MYPPVLLGLEAGLAIPQLPVPLVSTCNAKGGFISTRLFPNSQDVCDNETNLVSHGRS